MAEQCYFVNPSFESNVNIARAYSDNFDIVGRIQTIENMLDDLATNMSSSLGLLDTLMHRQSEQQFTLLNLMRDISKDIFIEKISVISGFTGNLVKDSINIWPSDTPFLEWESITIDKVSEDFDIIQGDFKAQIINDTIISVDTDTDGVYTRAHYKLPPGKTGAAIIEIPMNKIADKNGVPQIFIKQPTSSFMLYNDFFSSFPVPSFSDKITVMDSLSELIVYYKNTTIDKRNYLYAEAYPIEVLRDEIITGEQIWKSDKEISNISTFSLFQSVCDLNIITEGKTYSMQSATTLGREFSRLDLLGYSGGDRNTTYFKFPFPVDLSESISIYKNLDVGNEIFDWQFNFEGPRSETWRNPSELITSQYPNIGTYSNTKRYLYIKVNNFCESGYGYYTLNSEINCSWPLSEDNKFLWTGAGIECKATGPVEIRAKVTMPFNKNNFENEILGLVYPISQLGIS